MMKGLAFWQPWASLIAPPPGATPATRKWIETRPSPPGGFAHAGAHRGLVRRTYPGMRLEPFERIALFATARRPTARDLAVLRTAYPDVDPTYAALPLSAIVGTATPNVSDGTWALVGVEDQRPFGDFAPGRWAWLLDDVAVCDRPVPCTGRQGVFRLAHDVAEAVRDATAVPDSLLFTDHARPAPVGDTAYLPEWGTSYTRVDEQHWVRA